MSLRALLFASFSLLILPVSAALAGEPPVPIEGKLWVSGYEYLDGWHAYGYYLQGTSDQVTAWPEEIAHADVSPLGDALAYHVTAGSPWATTGDIWVSSIDGLTSTNISQAAGLSGINCFPCWSPDASQVAFRHVDPVVGQQPCDTGFQVWVMNADGTSAHRVSSEGLPSAKLGGWSPDGDSLLCALYGLADAVTIDLDGSNVTSLPNVRGEGADISPTGHQIAGTWAEEDTVGGELGVWRELRVADLDGSNPQTLVSQFIAHSDAQAMVDRLGLDPLVTDWVADIEWRVGPLFPQWSPKGDRIAFLAALPFDPEAADYREQVEVWIYTLSSADLTKITDNDSKRDIWLSWHGDNTFPDSPEVTVNRTTVSFTEVTAPGLTTILCDGDPPEVPTGSRFDYAFYELATTAEVTGPISICMTYTDEEVPPAAEAALAILHWDGAQWIDITTSRDPANNIICAQTDTLSPIALHGIRTTKFPDVPAWGFGTDGLDPHWAYYQVMACVEARIVSGYGDGTYQPTESVARDTMAVFIARAMAGGDANVPPGPDTATFNDVPTDYWSYKYIEYCVANDVVQGYDAVTYGPANLVNRDSMAVFIARAHADGDANVPAGPAEATFDDVPTDYWSYKYIEYCAAEQIVQGYTPTTYGPTGVVTRDQMAVFITRAFGLPM